MNRQPLQFKNWRPALCTAKQQPRPDVGDMIGLPYDRLPYVVVSIGEIPSLEWNPREEEVYARNHRHTPSGAYQPSKDEWAKRPFALRVRRHKPRDPQGEEVFSFRVSPGTGDAEWYILPKHYAVCADCGELTPCRHHLTQQIVQQESEIMERKLSILPGCCWACHEPVTKRQKSIAFDGENLDVPSGPPVVFHLRHGCFFPALRYEERWAEADPARKRRLACDGVIVHHYDGSECSTETACPGTDAHHSAMVNHQGYYKKEALDRLLKAGGFPAIDEKLGPLDVEAESVRRFRLPGGQGIGWRCPRCREAFTRGGPMARIR